MKRRQNLKSSVELFSESTPLICILLYTLVAAAAAKEE